MKQITLIIALAFISSSVLVLPQQAHASDLTAGLLSCWSFDETSGTRVDSYGSNDLTPTNTPGSGTGKHGNALDLERTSSQYVSIADASQTGLDFGSNDFTIGFWKNIESNDGVNYTAWFSKYVAAGNQTSYDLRYNNDTTNRHLVGMSSNGSTVTQRFLTGSAWSTATWYYIVVRYDASAGSVTIHRNDSSQGTMTGLPTSLFDTTAAFEIGRPTGGSYFDGLIDEFAVWNTYLSDTQLTELYDSTAGMSCSEIIATGSGQSEATTTPFIRMQGDIQAVGDVIFRR